MQEKIAKCLHHACCFIVVLMMGCVHGGSNRSHPKSAKIDMNAKTNTQDNIELIINVPMELKPGNDSVHAKLRNVGDVPTDIHWRKFYREGSSLRYARQSNKFTRSMGKNCLRAGPKSRKLTRKTYVKEYYDPG